MLMINVAILMSAYAIIQLITRVIDKYHLWTKGTNSVMIYFYWIKSMFKIYKDLDNIFKKNLQDIPISTQSVIHKN